MFKFFKNLFRKLFFIDDPLFNAIEDYRRETHQAIADVLSRPHKKSQFVKDYEKYLGLDLPDHYLTK
jgi:hypothetical protein